MDNSTPSLTCTVCGYDLRDLATSQHELCRCPECGNTRFPTTHAEKKWRRSKTNIKLISLLLLLIVMPFVVLCIGVLVLLILAW